MTEKQMNAYFTAARGEHPNEAAIDHKFRQLTRSEEHRHLSIFHLRPMAGMAMLLLLAVGGLGLAHAFREAQLVAAHDRQEQIDMREARRNMLSNTEHIYSILFNQGRAE